MSLPTNYEQCAHLLQSTELISEEAAEFCVFEVQANFKKKCLHFATLYLGAFGVCVLLAIIRCAYLSIRTLYTIIKNVLKGFFCNLNRLF
jgi:AraC-like DNA-binding protein